ncbi:MAG: 3'-5' exonuclease [Bogoriella megaspora]|nr:MAG: 3'-5' exonuclease [Bogoriella megaspora]
MVSLVHSYHQTQHDAVKAGEPMELSSNWKALQQKLHNESRAGKESEKRKRSDENLARQKKRAKFNDLKRLSVETSHNKNIMDTAEHSKMRTNGESNLLTSTLPNETSENSSISTNLLSSTSAKKYVALDCEMVGVGPSPDVDSILARVSVVNYHGAVLYDTYVLPPDGTKVTDYRTAVSGIRAEHLKPQPRPTTNGVSEGINNTSETLEKNHTDIEPPTLNLHNEPLASLSAVQVKLDELLTDRILIGHALRNDLTSLLLSHPHHSIRDTSRYLPFRAYSGGRTPSLRKLAKIVLNREIQTGEHSSVEDARAAMDLYKAVRKEWEGQVGVWRGNGKRGPAKGRVRVDLGKKEVGDGEEEGSGGSGEESEDEDVKKRREKRKVRLKKKKAKKRTKRA